MRKGEMALLPKAACRNCCSCNKYLNVPFVMLKSVQQCITTDTSQRDVLAAAYTAKRKRGMLGQEVAVLAHKNDRLVRDVQANLEKVEEAKDHLEGMKKKLQLEENSSADEINVAAGNIHAKCTKLQQ